MRITKNPVLQLLLFCFVLAFPADSSGQSTDSLDIKIGQMILIGFPKAEVDAEVLREIREGKVGSIIIFEKNIPARNSFVALKKMVWTYQSAANIPLFVSIDQEGGKVNRLKDKYGFPRSITADAMGKANSLDSVRFYAEATATTLAGLGINVNFAPVVDLAANASNPVIVRHGRAFGNNEDSVAILAREFIIQHRKYGIMTSLKHFPGHGSSSGDTHLELTDVTETWTERELKPYRDLISQGYADAVMTSHIVNRALDKEGRPGTLSEPILNGILRKKLNFDGIVFSDDMQMHAITKHFGLDEAIKLAVNAGVDIMTFSNNIAGSDERTVDKVHAIIRKMVEDGTIKRERIDESFRRIIAVKRRLADKDKMSTLQQQTALLENNEKGLKNEIERLKGDNEKLKQELEQQKTTKRKKKRSRKDK